MQDKNYVQLQHEGEILVRSIQVFLDGTHYAVRKGSVGLRITYRYAI